jgi:hypothetical protein
MLMAVCGLSVSLAPLPQLPKQGTRTHPSAGMRRGTAVATTAEATSAFRHPNLHTAAQTCRQRSADSLAQLEAHRQPARSVNFGLLHPGTLVMLRYIVTPM